ncbi:hypothetical protein LCGC14_0313070 [marine sediment metagenome]|uniref:Terminase large subunit gp17-like C-terminal domain-containing protein n=1 Tax=marine sediment metagenome TaxID=412755 RepID=A0A0F9TLL0_9ZZZZ
MNQLLHGPADFTPALTEVVRRIQEAKATVVPPPPPTLGDYGRIVHGLPPAIHHKVWLEALAEVSPDNPLLIIAPPGYAKTQWVGVHWPAWLLGQDPSLHIIYLSSAAGLAVAKSLAVRDTIRDSAEFHDAFPGVELDDRRGTAGHAWYLKRPNIADPHPSFSAYGIAELPAGPRADVLILDDVNDLENTATRYQREKIIEKVDRVALTRLTDKGVAVCIMTRWHSGDLAAHLLQREWTLIHQKAIQDDGTALWPERWSIERLQREQTLAPLTFRRVYQGDIGEEEGNVFRGEWWQSWRVPTEEERRALAEEMVPLPPEVFSREILEDIITVWDTAFEEGQEADWSATATWGRRGINLYLLDAGRWKVGFPDLKHLVERHIERIKPNRTWVEYKASGISLVQQMQSQGLQVQGWKEERGKLARAHAVTDIFASMRVWLPPEAPWLQEWKAEHLEFPSADHDDWVDTTTMALLLLQGSAIPDWWLEPTGRRERSEIELMERMAP